MSILQTLIREIDDGLGYPFSIERYMIDNEADWNALDTDNDGSLTNVDDPYLPYCKLFASSTLNRLLKEYNRPGRYFCRLRRSFILL